MKSRVPKVLVVLVALGVVALTTTLAAAGGRKFGCSASANSTLKSCRSEAVGDYWLAIGKCQNLAAGGERNACSRDAYEELGEAREECRDQYEARLEVCEELGEAPYAPVIDPANFVSEIDNPYLPYRPGATWTYEGDTEDGHETIVVEVTNLKKEILGVECTVVRDRVYLDGDLIEDTLDYYAQDAQGNVWYFGEISYEIEDGQIVSLEGSWKAGVDGAAPGIVMHEHPVVGQLYRQEFLLGEAEDVGKLLAENQMVSVPAGDFAGCRQTLDGTPLEPDAVEHKYYASGIGLVLEVDPESGERIELVAHTP